VTPHETTISEAVQALEEARGNLRDAVKCLKDHPERAQTESLMTAVTDVESRLAQQFSDERERESIIG